VLLRAADLLRRDRESLAALEVRDCGKPLAEALDDVSEAAFMVEYYGGWATKLAGEIPPVGRRALSLVLREPAGVAALIVPWNYPLLMAAQKLAPALAAGCTCVLKPAEQTPLTALALPGLLAEAGLPPGALNVVTGIGIRAGASLVRHPDVDVVSFTASLEVGRFIQRTAAETVKRVTLELGGKSPNIIFSDANLEASIAGTCAGLFGNQGEVCSAGSRVFVERTVFDDVLAGIVEMTQQYRLGHGLDPATTMGPLISNDHRQRVLSYVEAGRAEGAEQVATGSLPTDPRLAHGFFVAPTVFAGVTSRMRIVREEIFGPVMVVAPFDSVDEVIGCANDTRYGLAAAVWTQDVGKALAVARQIRAGTVWINDSQPAPTEAPWGGFKQFGLGRELGRLALDGYLETKHVYLNLAR